jgi:hypothetical protein
MGWLRLCGWMVADHAELVLGFVGCCSPALSPPLFTIERPTPFSRSKRVFPGGSPVHFCHFRPKPIRVRVQLRAPPPSCRVEGSLYRHFKQTRLVIQRQASPPPEPSQAKPSQANRSHGPYGKNEISSQHFSPNVEEVVVVTHMRFVRSWRKVLASSLGACRMRNTVTPWQPITIYVTSPLTANLFLFFSSA